MKLEKLLSIFDDRYAIKEHNLEIIDLVIHTDSIVPGCLYLSLSESIGLCDKYASDAAENGAAIVFKRGKAFSVEYISSTPVYTIPNLHNKYSDLVRVFFPKAQQLEHYVGITGTNGKTTVANWIAYLARKQNVKFASMGTLGVNFGEGYSYSKFTTPSLDRVYNNLSSLHSLGVKGCAMEASSHGLEQGRLFGVPFEIGIFTNFSQDHLDYHGSMESYFNAKTKLFTDTSLKYSILNFDDPAIRRWALKSDLGSKLLAYGTDEKVKSFSDEYFYAKNIKAAGFITSFTLCCKQGQFDVRLPTLGDFNVSNALAAIAASCCLGLELKNTVQAIATIPSVPGRLELVSMGGDNHPYTWVDFAHTPDGLEKVLSSVSSGCVEKLVTVFGCGGERDKDKRPLMLKTVAKWSDIIILTQDNSRGEPFKEILDDIMLGVEKLTKDKTIIISDRKTAIQFAIDIASCKDHVVIAGRGHEQVHDLGKQKLNYTDKSVVMDVLSIEKEPEYES